MFKTYGSTQKSKKFHTRLVFFSEGLNYTIADANKLGIDNRVKPTVT